MPELVQAHHVADDATGLMEAEVEPHQGGDEPEQVEVQGELLTAWHVGSSKGPAGARGGTDKVSVS